MKKRTLGLSLVVSALFVIGCGGGGSTSSDTPSTPTTPTGTLSDSDKQAYLSAINAARSVDQDCGIEGVFPAATPLTWSDALYNAAYEHSRDLALSDTFDHDGSGTTSDTTATAMNLSYSTFTDRIVRNGYANYSYIGENITAGNSRDTAQEAVDSWITSDHHCANIMNPDFKEVGLGHYEDSASTYTHYWTQDFGAK